MRRMFSQKQIQEIAKKISQAEQEHLEVYELPSEPTEAQCLEALNHTILKHENNYFYLCEPNMYVCISFGDDGLVNGSASSLIIDDEGNLTRTDYSISDELGTKLYKHTIEDSTAGYIFTLITTSPDAIDFQTYDTYVKIKNYLRTINVLSFKNDLKDIQWSNEVNSFFSLDIINSDVLVVLFDDWDLTSSTDTVIAL